ncbi:hypothetical protein GQ55_2G401100 [Panicum hallii var. hallii]|uniref:Reverse transcriptase zinc-binding domain-containing protein n=1 Tax=Panicum hallii var. hallii TaxID=1504633 RepID=A0A2T7EXH1_9POAL|nr:hypothetical protein GQ55_2G401100 [Panicum hallii var. hallii]
MYLLPKTICKRIDQTRKRFFWQESGLKKKYHLVKWEKLNRPRKKGGLGIQDIRKMNQSLLCGWWWKLEKKEGMWQKLVEKKYVMQSRITRLKYKPTNSSVWNNLLKVKDIYLKGRRIKVGNGRLAEFWEGQWCGAVSLKDKFPELYNICNEQVGSVAAFAERGWRLTFRRWLDENLQNQFRRLRDMLTSVALSREDDSPVWAWEKSGAFSVKSTYAHLCSNQLAEPNKHIWKAKIPLKNKIFMWLAQQDAILTRDNLAKRNWQGDLRRSFCQCPETAEHLCFTCSLAICRPCSLEQFWHWVYIYIPSHKQYHMVGLTAICWALWKARNLVCFEQKRVKTPTEIVCSASSFLSYWAGLQKTDDRAPLEAGAEALKAAALFFHLEESPNNTGVVLLR